MEFIEYQKAYTSRDMAEKLKTTQATINRWAKVLEEEGYPFFKGDNDTRLYTQADIDRFKTFKRLISEHKMSVQSASKLLIQRYSEELHTQRVGTAHEELDKQINEENNTQIALNTQAMNEHLMEFKKEVLEQINKQHKERLLIEKEWNEKHDKRFMQTMNEMQETKKMVRELQQQLEEQASTKEGNWFTRLFKR